MLNKIIDNSKRLIQKINPEKKWLWIVLFLGINFAHLYIFHHFVINREEGKLYALGGDGDQYVGATESLLENGEMTFIKSNQHLFYSNLLPQDEFDLGMYYAFRTPGFVFVHLPLRWFFDLHTSLNIFIVLQTIVNACAKFLMCLLFYRIFKSKVLFAALTVGFALAIQLSFWNNHLMTESFGESFLIFAIYLFHKFLQNEKSISLCLSGLFLIVAVHFRPFLAPLFLPYVIILFFKYKNSFFKTIFPFFIFPFLIHGTWIIRNYLKTDRFILIAPTLEWVDFTNLVFKENRLISMNLSLSPLWWEKDSPMYYLENEEDIRNPMEVYGKPFFIHLEDTNKIIEAKRLYLLSKDTIHNSLQERQSFELGANQLLTDVHQKYLQNNSFNCLTSRVKAFFLYLNQPLYKPFISVKYPINVAIVFVESLCNRFIYSIGIMSVFIGLYRFRKNVFILAILSLITFLVFFFVNSNYIEKRGFYIQAIFFLIFGIEWTYHLFKKKYYWIISLLMVLLICLISFDMVTTIKWS